MDLQPHTAGILFVLLGAGGLGYALVATSLSFQGDFPLTKAEQTTHPPTTRNRLWAAAAALLPLSYGIYLLLWR